MYTEEKKLTQEEISWRQFNKYVKTALIRKRKDYLQKKARIMKHEMSQNPETILLYSRICMMEWMRIFFRSAASLFCNVLKFLS